MWIKVDAHEYHVFFEALAKAFRKEYGEACPHEWDDRKLWKLGVKVEGQSKMQYRSRQLFEAPNAHSHEYFWVRNKAAKKEIEEKGNEAEVQVNAAALILAFNYLEQYLDLTSLEKPLGEKTKAKGLWKQFFEKDNERKNTASNFTQTITKENDSFIGNNVLSILDDESIEYQMLTVNDATKQVIYEYIFNSSNPLNKREKAFKFFEVHKLLSDDEICNLLSFRDWDIQRDSFAALDRLISPKNDINRVYTHAVYVAGRCDNRRIYLCGLVKDLVAFLPSEVALHLLAFLLDYNSDDNEDLYLEHYLIISVRGHIERGNDVSEIYPNSSLNNIVRHCEAYASIRWKKKHDDIYKSFFKILKLKKLELYMYILRFLVKRSQDFWINSSSAILERRRIRTK